MNFEFRARRYNVIKSVTLNTKYWFFSAVAEHGHSINDRSTLQGQEHTVEVAASSRWPLHHDYWSLRDCPNATLDSHGAHRVNALQAT